MKIWCVEDDANVRDIEIYTLRSAGYEAEGFADGHTFFHALKKDKPDLIMLDIMLPGEDGVTVLRRLRRASETAGIPIIMATAKGAEYDKIQSLDLGADDYLVKPFGMMEMLSRIKAVLRRCCPIRSEEPLTIDALVLDPVSRTVHIDREPVTLTYKEFEILYLFLKHPNTAFTRDRLLSHIWGDDFMSETRTVDVHIRTLRQKHASFFHTSERNTILRPATF